MTLTAAGDAPDQTRHRPSRPVLIVLGVAVLLTAIAMSPFVIHAWRAHDRSGPALVPQSAAMEQRLGVRFSRVAVVGDGGLVVLTYVVLDSEKATRFESAVTHPPVLSSESRQLSISRVSLMKQGHELRSGATYYLVYQNKSAALRSGEQATISYGRLRLAHVPVL